MSWLVPALTLSRFIHFQPPLHYSGQACAEADPKPQERSRRPSNSSFFLSSALTEGGRRTRGNGGVAVPGRCWGRADRLGEDRSDPSAAAPRPELPLTDSRAPIQQQKQSSTHIWAVCLFVFGFLQRDSGWWAKGEQRVVWPLTPQTTRGGPINADKSGVPISCSENKSCGFEGIFFLHRCCHHPPIRG